MTATVSIATGALVGIFLSAAFGDPLNWAMIVGAALIIPGTSAQSLHLGVHLVYSSTGDWEHGEPVPLYAEETLDSSWLTWDFIKRNFQDMLREKESQRIFGFLVINLLFMFVELAYGTFGML
ncbi:MAG TPA: hypothetical protein V6D20_11195, partial [Candidatus Obscuribacterales bacterium]